MRLQQKYSFFFFTLVTLIEIAVFCPIPGVAKQIGKDTALGHGYVLSNGKLYSGEDFGMLPEEHYRIGIQNIEEKNWKEGARHFKFIEEECPDSPFIQEAVFNLGVCYYHLENYDFAEQAFAHYLKLSGQLKYFEAAFKYRFEIAEKFRNGAKKHMFGYEKLPMWQSAVEDAISIYDDIIHAMPSDDLAVQSMMNKASIYHSMCLFDTAQDIYKQIVRNYPKHPIAGDAFLGIARAFYQKAKLEAYNPYYIESMEVELKNFRRQFPQDARLIAAEHLYLQMKENYAAQLTEIGKFYERKNEQQASVLYYMMALKKFPGTKGAGYSQERLKALKAFAHDVVIPEDLYQ